MLKDFVEGLFLVFQHDLPMVLIDPNKMMVIFDSSNRSV